MQLNLQSNLSVEKLTPFCRYIWGPSVLAVLATLFIMADLTRSAKLPKDTLDTPIPLPANNGKTQKS